MIVSNASHKFCFVPHFLCKRYLLHPFVFFLFLFYSGNLFSQGTDTWTQKADFPGVPRMNAAAFVVNGQAFLGTGQDSLGNLLNDFWKFDPSTNVWAQVASFPGVNRKAAVGFAIGSKGYLGSGDDGSSYLKDFWEFNPATNSWLQVQDLGQYRSSLSSGRRDAVAVVARSKAYLLCGYDGSSGYVKQNWEFDPTADTSWTLRRNLANVADATLFGRRWSSGFSIDDTVYFGTGYSFSQDLKSDYWKYNPLLDAWTQIADFGGSFRSNTISFALFGKGYVGCGTNRMFQEDLWRYDPHSNTWTQVASFGGGPRTNAVSFAVADHGFAGLGNDSMGILKNDMWEYIPDSTTGLLEPQDFNPQLVFPNPAVSTFTITHPFPSVSEAVFFSLYTAMGKCVRTLTLNKPQLQIDCSDLTPGVYYYSIRTTTKKFSGKLIVR